MVMLNDRAAVVRWVSLTTPALLVDQADLAVVGVPGAGSVEMQGKVLRVTQPGGIRMRGAASPKGRSPCGSFWYPASSVRSSGFMTVGFFAWR